MNPKTRKLTGLFLALFCLSCHTTFAFYNPETGRWLNRDPIEEKGGVNTYVFVKNTAQSWIDTDGRATIPSEEQAAAAGAGESEPTNAECSKFAWWDKIVGVTLASDCKPQLTKWGKQMPNFLQDCVLRHEGVHSKFC